MKTLAASAFLAVCAVSAGYCAPAETKTFPAAGLAGIYASAETGNVFVSGGAAGDISVEISDNDPGKCILTSKVEGGRLLLKAEGIRLPAPKSWRNLYGFLKRPGKKQDCPVNFRISSPSSVLLDVENGTGATDISAISSDVKIQSGTGRVYVRGLTGGLDIDTGTGPVEGAACVKDLRLRNGTGKIKLAGLCGPASAETGTGNLDLEWAKVPASGQVRVESGTGAVRLAFPAAAKLSASLTSGTGAVTNEFGNAGGFPVTVESGTGAVSLLKSSSK